MPGWVMAIFVAIFAAIPAGIFCTVTLFGYTYSGYGTEGLSGAPGPLLAAGVIPALVTIGAAYFVARRRNSAGK